MPSTLKVRRRTDAATSATVRARAALRTQQSLEPSEGLTGASRASEAGSNSGMRCAAYMMIVSVRSTSLDLPRLGLYATSRRRSSRFPRGRFPYTEMIAAASTSLKLPRRPLPATRPRPRCLPESGLQNPLLAERCLPKPSSSKGSLLLSQRRPPQE